MRLSFYYLVWMVLLIAGLWISLTVFIWALRRGQFREQDRARYLPLRQEDMTLRQSGRGAHREACVGIGILVIGLSGMIAVIVTMILRTPGVVR